MQIDAIPYQSGTSIWVAKLQRALPSGRLLPHESWASRHRVILWLLWLHVGVLWIFGGLTGHDALHSGLVASAVAVCAALASWPGRGRRFRSVLASLGLLSASTGLVHLSGGYIELHFHFFVMVAVIALYQDWTPFLVAVGLVVLHHGLGSAFDPAGVFNHPSAIAHPWLWAGIHGGFILGIVIASLVNWRLNEAEYARRLVEQERAEQVVRESEAHFRSLVQNAADIIAVVDAAGLVGYVSPSHQRLLGYEADVVIGNRIHDRVHADDRMKLDEMIADLLAYPDAPQSLEIRARSTDGAWRIFDVIATNRLHDPGIAGIVVNARDITERKSLEDQLVHQAFHDSLTGLPNRALFMDRLEHALVRGNRGADRLAVLYLDFDQFKVVNDSLGHSAGDQLLVAMSQRLRTCTRSGDTVARLGGDEFAILFEDAGEADAIELAQRITDRMRAPFILDGHSIFGGASVGIACKRSPLDSAGDLIRNADVAMYAAKQRGKGQFVVFDDSMHSPGLERLQLEAELRQAIELDQFRVYYQPIFNLHTGELDEVEALVRWEHPDRGLVMPGEFIPMAEESGLIVPIGIWVMREACGQVRRWQSARIAGRPLAVSVNLSPRMLQHGSLVEDVAHVLSETGLEPGLLRLEITEGTLVQDGPAAAKVMNRLKSLGVRLAMDDFGTGYSSLSSLQSFPFDILKIDQSFVRALDHGSESVAIVQAIIDLAGSLNLTVTGEGIETAEQMQLLQTLGSKHGQGYFFSKPCSAADMDRYIADHFAHNRPFVAAGSR